MPADTDRDHAVRSGATRAGRLAVLALVLSSAACSGTPATVPVPAAPPPSTAGQDHAHQHLAAGPAPSGAPGGTIVVHASDQLRDTLTLLVHHFEEGFPGAKVAVEYGAETEHAKHIRDGAPIDVFVSANADAARILSGHVRGKPVVVARDPIVIAVPSATRIKSVLDLPGVRVAMCVEITSCGRAGRAALAAAKLTVQPVSVEPQPASVLDHVRSGAADAALVYRTDVVTSGKDLRAVDFEEAASVSDEFAASRLTTSKNTVGGDAFVAFLSSALARHVFADAGLSPT